MTPKRIRRNNGTVLTPEMVVIVTTERSTYNPFDNGAEEIKEAYMRLYRFDYEQAMYSRNDFDFRACD